jgi:hypothetical protein
MRFVERSFVGELWYVGNIVEQNRFVASSGGRARDLFASLCPGLITGAADDDPSGIATYSQVGAQFGFAMLWTMLFSFPLMAAIQEICATGTNHRRRSGCESCEVLPKACCASAGPAPVRCEHL